MSVAEDLLAEIHTWRAAWRQIEIFLDRMDEMRKKDAPHAKRVRALVRTLAFIHLEAKLRAGNGLDLPFEMAIAGEGPGDIWESDLIAGGGFRTATFTDVEVPPPGSLASQKDTLEHRLPGLFDIEIAAASLSLPAKDEPTDDNVREIRLSPAHTLFTRYDADKKDWVPVELPVYHFGDLSSPITVDTDNWGMFPRDSRKKIILESLKADQPPPSDPNARPEYHPKLWSDFRGQRTLAEPHDSQPLDSGGDVAGALQAACEKGKAAAIEARDFVTKEGVGPASQVEDDVVIPILDNVVTGFAKRAALYKKLATGTGGADTDDEQALLQTSVVDILSNAVLEYVLTESVDAQIAYPDGTLRQLRTLEWTFLMHYNARLPWFWYRRERALKPLLSRFLRSFRTSAARLQSGEATTFPSYFTLNRAAAVGDASVQLAPRKDGLLHDLSKIVPGQIAHLQGDRSTAALILGVEPPVRVDGAIVQRLRVSPLQVSLATGKDLPGSAGLIPPGALLSPGPGGPSSEEIWSGTSADHPTNDGVILELVSLWSKLCLLIGLDAVETQGSLGVTLPSPLPRTMHVPVLGPVRPGADRVLVRVKDLESLGFNAKKPHFARAGEMLLLKGRAPTEDDGHPGDLWQTAVQVRAVVRVAEKDAQKDLSVVTLPCPICCEGPGELVAVLISDPKLPVDLASEIVLHRDFLGFGTPSLSSEHILPNVIDPDSSTLSDTVYRGPELEVAVSVLKHWLGDRTSP